MTSLIVAVLGVAHATLRRANAELESRASDLAAANQNLQTQIKEREKAEDALRQAQKMEAIGKLTAGVAHDFNNLLQVVLGNIDTISRKTSESNIRRMAEIAGQAAERGGRLTQQLLAFARKQPLAPKPLDANGLVVSMIDLLRSTLGETVRVGTVLQDDIWKISADSNQLESALLNLAVNARDAMPVGGAFTIEMANAQLDEAYAATQDEVRSGDYVVIAVTDNGTGMTPEIVARAFDPFFTTKEVGKGSGLGLSQVYGFMKQSGGHAKIDSESGRGTTMKLYLSRHIEHALEPAVAHDIRQSSKKAKGELVLVVEDNDDVRAYSVAMLKELGYRIIEAPDGEVAFRVIDTKPDIRLLFTDIGLPGGINGRQLADEARRRRPGLTVLYTSGYAHDAFAHDGDWNPESDLVPKPYLLRSARNGGAARLAKAAA